MKKILAVVALTALTGCATTLSQSSQKVGNWTKVTESADGIYYVDLSTVRQSSYRYAKTIRVSTTNQVIGTGRWIDCAPSPFRSKWSMADTAVFENGKPVKIEVINTGRFSEVAPGSTDDKITKFICAATPVGNRQQHYAEFNSAPVTNQTARGQNTDQGSYVKMILLGYLSPDLAGQEAMKLGYGNRWFIVEDTKGNPAQVEIRADGRPLQGIYADGTSMPWAELIGFAGINQCAENGSCYGDISAETGRPKNVYVRGYYRKDGTYVPGHYRSSPSRPR